MQKLWSHMPYRASGHMAADFWYLLLLPTAPGLSSQSCGKIELRELAMGEQSGRTTRCLRSCRRNRLSSDLHNVAIFTDEGHLGHADE
jgi:hypothetical protein